MRGIAGGGAVAVAGEVLCLLTLAAAPPASAGTAEVVFVATSRDARGTPTYHEKVRYTAGPGERNDLDVRVDGRVVTLRDAGAAIAPGRGCAETGPSAVTCTTERGLEVEVLAGDRDDSVRGELATSPPHGSAFHGGSGADQLRLLTGEAQWVRRSLLGDEGNDTLAGGDAAEHLGGGPGRDVLRGGGGNDGLAGDGTGTAEPDVMDGEEGRDVLAYGDLHPPVVVDLADDLPEGAPGEGDVAQAVEGAFGTPGADTLRGDDRANYLDGGRAGGSTGDVLMGREGDDRLYTGMGPDALDGGTGNDYLQPGAGTDGLAGGEGDDVLDLTGDWTPSFSFGGRLPADAVACSDGMDRVLGPQLRDVMRPECERVEFRLVPVGPMIAVSPRHPPTAHSLVFDIALEPSRGAVPRCATLKLGSAPGTLGWRAFRVRRTPFRVAVNLSARGRRVLARDGPARVEVRFKGFTRCRGGKRRDPVVVGGYTAEL